MKLSFLFYISLIFAVITSPSTQCYGLMRKFNSESQLSLLCRKTTNFGFCAYTLGADPRSAGADVNGLARIALTKLQDHVRQTSSYLQGLKGRVVGKEAQAVGTCIRLYGTVSSQHVLSAITSLNGKAYVAAKQAARAAMNGGEACQQGIIQNPSPKWQMLTSRNKFTHDLSQLSHDLIGLLG